MKEPNELEDVLDRAVESYLICRIRNKARGGPVGDLSKMYPDHFKKMSNGNFHWIGESSDEIVEGYLEQFGYPPASHLWHSLCELVASRAERTASKDY
jgi:hypothetical protein